MAVNSELNHAMEMQARSFTGKISRSGLFPPCGHMDFLMGFAPNNQQREPLSGETEESPSQAPSTDAPETLARTQAPCTSSYRRDWCEE